MISFWNSSWTRKSTKIGSIILTGIVGAVSIGQAREIRVRVDRALTLQQLQGQVRYWRDASSRPARFGDRLQFVGEGASTGQNSSVALQIDSGIGQVTLAERTKISIRALEVTPSGGRVTRLTVSSGRVQVRARPFSNPDSQLEIDTPAGVAGVRGTEFGVNVQRSGKMSLATNKGSVATNAQGQSVLVNSGFQNFTIPGESPSDPVPISNDTSLDYKVVKKIDRQIRQLQLQGRVDPVNIVLINGIEQNTDRNGRFDVELDVPSFPKVRVTVVTPLGLRRDYALAF